MSEARTLTDADVDAIAAALERRLAPKLEQPGPPARIGLIDAAEAARRLGTGRQFVYDHADELGVVRLTTGPRARLRFDAELVERLRRARAAQPEPARPARRPGRARRRTRGGVPLLEVRG
jgi:hypothetical protein